MQRFVTFFAVLITTAFVAGCGGSSSTTTEHTTIYAVPASLAPAPSLPNYLMGGAIQGGAIAAKFTNYSVSTFAGTTGTVGSTDNTTTTPLTTAQFNRPMGVTTDGTNIYVTDYLNNAIRKIDTTTQLVTTLTDLKENDIAVTLNHPSDITTDGINLYVADSGNNVIRKIDPTTNIVTTIGSTTGVAGAVDSDVIADVRFKQPTGITTDGVNIYVADYGNHTIRRIVISSNAVTTLAGTPGTPGSKNGPPDTAHFNLPSCITTDRTKLYVTDFNNRTVRRIDILSGTVDLMAGIVGKNGSTDTAPGVTATFNQPNGITTDGTNLYVTDSFNNTIRKIVIASQVVTTLAGTIGVAGDVNSPDTPTSFNTPIGITTDGRYLYVADSGNNTIRRIK